MHGPHLVLVVFCTLLVVLSSLPVVVSMYQFLLLIFSFRATHLEDASRHLPRVSILIPAWNEGAVIGATIDRLMRLRYPRDRLRVYVIDDASTDETPHVAIAKSKLWPRNVFHIRRVAGGEGKAHTLNYGLHVLWRSDWTEAVLIMDADVIYTEDSLTRMARHLVDPTIGAVTAYIKEGSRDPNYVQRYITFEYITATGASRRAQNVLGFLACLSGGAQLHSRVNLLAIGGQIFSDTLAEDTFTTFRTQLRGRRAVFEPNAIVYAEEPDSLWMLWKQRLRWARGNVQITQVFWDLWFNRKLHPSMGSLAMGLLWFSIFLMPVFQITGALALVVLYFVDDLLSWTLFRGYWILATMVYLFVTLASLAIDWESGRKSVVEGILFPGLISLCIIVYSLVPSLVAPLVDAVLGDSDRIRSAAVILMYLWLALSMAVSYLALVFEKNPKLARLAPFTLLLGGYGSLLCAVTLGAYVKELSGASRSWDKTVKTGKVG
jgi:cellulose synthase/poly-beta-1,6-N-acetylglucosamine synthase-like glycosyltransferase